MYKLFFFFVIFNLKLAYECTSFCDFPSKQFINFITIDMRHFEILCFCTSLITILRKYEGK